MTEIIRFSELLGVVHLVAQAHEQVRREREHDLLGNGARNGHALDIRGNLDRAPGVVDDRARGAGGGR